jgi:hypothetical protein
VRILFEASELSEFAARLLEVSLGERDLAGAAAVTDSERLNT